MPHTSAKCSVPAVQVLVGPEPTKWQAVPSDVPIAVQVARDVELPSVQVVAARRIDEPAQLTETHNV